MEHNIQQIDEISKAVQIIQELRKDFAFKHIILGETLNIVREKDLWKHYANHLIRFDDFLKEMRLAHSSAYYYMAIAKKFGAYIKEKKMEIEFNRLVKLLPITTSTNTSEWLHKAQELTSQDFNDEVRVAHGSLSQLDCIHSDCEQWSKCKTCQKFFKKI